MDLPQLRAFLEIAREGNLTRAANTLCVSQPALSSRIKALEDEIGVKLFQRNAKGMALTRHGEILSEEAARTLQAAQGFMTLAKTMNSTLHGKIRLGTISEPVALRLGEFLSGLLVTCPQVTVSITQAISGVVIDGIVAGELDAGYVIGRTLDEDVVGIELAPVRFVVVGPLEWRERLQTAGWADIALYPWIGAPPKCSYNAILQDLFMKQGVKPRKIAEVDQENMLRDLVARGLGLSILREDQAIAAEEVGQLCIWPNGETHSVLSFVQRRSASSTPLHLAMMTVVRNIWTLLNQNKDDQAEFAAGA